jgi:hypothetical protein
MSFEWSPQDLIGSGLQFTGRARCCQPGQIRAKITVRRKFEKLANILLLLVLTLAAGLRIYGLDWSLPHTYEEATPLRVAIGMWGWPANGPTTFNPLRLT